MTVFHGSTRALVDWAAIQSGEFSVAESFTRSRQVLGQLTCVWYLSTDGKQAEFDADGARSMTIQAAAAHHWSAEREGQLTSFMKMFAEREEPVQLVLPAVKAPDGAVVLVDGNHRACAAFRAAADVRLLLFVVHGSSDATLLPDLRHHL